MQWPPASTRIGPGEMIDGKFRVERVLGVGGMGFVVAARQMGLERRVALKFIRASHCDPESMARFLREARAVAKLRSEHVARVLDVTTVQRAPAAGSAPDTPMLGTPYIVMEYLEGRDLASLVRERGPRPIGEAVAFVLQACEAIAEAHAHGIVHRDLKPENLFLTARVDGQPLIKVLDFGISKLTGQSSVAPDGLSLTHTADLVGSPSYMSPEQLRAARSVDLRSDIWSLGVILFELLTGRLPFQATTIMQLCAAVLEAEPMPIARARADVPPPLADAIARCLRKSPGERFASVADLATTIEPFATGIERGFAERLRRISSLPPSRGAESGPPSYVLSAKGGTDAAWAETRRDATWTLAMGTRAPLAWALAIAAAIAFVASFAIARAFRAPEPASATESPTESSHAIPLVSDAGDAAPARP